MELGNNLSEDLKTNEDKSNSAKLIQPFSYNVNEFASETSKFNIPFIRKAFCKSKNR